MQKVGAVEDRQAARRELVAFLLDHLGRDGFVSFLRDHGYSEVVEAIPPSKTEVYVEELALALDRRGRLDGDFVVALTRATNAGEQLGRIAGQLGIAVALPIEQEAVEDLVQALTMSTFDEPSWLDTLCLGSPWREVLVGQGPEKPSVVIPRLARDPTPAGRAALGWLCARLVDVAQDSKLLEAARAVMAAAGPTEVVDDAAVVGPGSDFPPSVPDHDVLPVKFLSRGIDAARGVVLVRVLSGDPPEVKSNVTGWLLSPSLVVVPAHLWLPVWEPRRPPDEDQVFQVLFGFDEGGEEYSSVVTGRVEVFDLELDLALIRLAEPAHDHSPLRVRPDAMPATAASRITLIHHQQAGPKVFSLHGGRVVSNDGHKMVYQAATGAGSTGAPVFDDQWRVVGTHHGWKYMHIGSRPGLTRAKFGTATPALLRWIRETAGKNGRLWREVVAAQPDLKTIDATIRHTFAEQERTGLEPRCPMIIRVFDENASLHHVPDLTIDSRTGIIVSATGTPRSLNRLAEDPAVLSVEASLPSGMQECWKSVPHVGAEAVHTSSGERGGGALIAVIDNGVDVLHEAFLDDQHKTRIVAFWDQRNPNAPIGHSNHTHTVSDAGSQVAKQYKLTYGAFYAQEDIQTFVDTQTLPDSFPPRPTMAHGTQVASIAAGRRTGKDIETDFGGGVAPEAKLVVVRPDPEHASIGYAKGYIDALNFVGDLADHLTLPVVVNISAGMNAGAHDGNSDLEITCESFLKHGRAPGRAIVKSAGNERQALRHASLEVPQGGEFSLTWHTELKINGDRKARDLLELWFPGNNTYRFQLVSPSKNRSPHIDPTIDPLHANANELLGNGNRFAIRHTRYHADNGYGSLRLEIFPESAEVECGRWELIIEGVTVIKDEPIHAWIELSNDRSAIFSEGASDDVTVTIPGTAEHVITVGAIEVGNTMRSFKHSSRGPTRGRVGAEKPVIVAPGVSIRAGRTGTLRDADRLDASASGTSFAAPHVAGAIALMLSARAKDPDKPQLNTNQIQSALQNSARHFTGRWHHTTGFGALDVQRLMEQITLMP